jgi:O-antigen biosynthesis alpha-1,2-rhamnosyltransferase
VRRVFLDCTSTRASRYNTGIQRAARNLVNASLTAAGPWSCTAIIHNGRYYEAIDGLPVGAAPMSTTPTVVDRLRTAFHRVRAGAVRMAPGTRGALHSQCLEYALRRTIHSAQNAHRKLRSLGARSAGRIEFRGTDVLVLLDPIWSIDLSRELQRARATGADVWVVVYDLIPLERPDLAPEGSPIMMDKWLRSVTPYATGMLGISGAVADGLRIHLEKEYAAPLPRVDYFYLGAGLDGADVHAQDLAAVEQAFVNAGATVYLAVGTIEPRKNHALMLDAFDRLWSEGKRTRLVIFGRLGWRSDALSRRIRAHPEFGKRLVWFESGTDAELDQAYRRASALIFASSCEGFGLPLVEAMQYGLPVLASDIAVFREIAGDYPTYFSLDAERPLDGALRRMETAAAAGALARLPPRYWISWAESSRVLLERVTAPAQPSRRPTRGPEPASE